MNAEIMRDGDVRALRIEGEMTIYRAGELKALLQTALDGAVSLEVDLSAVTELDTAGVQILMAAKKTALAKQLEMRLVAHSQAVTEVFETLDLTAHFGDPLLLS